jgi:DNA processing protein
VTKNSLFTQSSFLQAAVEGQFPTSAKERSSGLNQPIPLVSLSDELQLHHWLYFIRDPRLSSKQKRELLDYLGGPQQIYQMPAVHLTAIIRQNGARRPAIQAQFGNIEADIQADIKWLCQDGNHLITLNDQHYPALLREIYDPPIALFAKGDLACLQDPVVSIVGSRRPSPGSVKLTQTLASDLAQLGIIVCSGMALGVDAAAHRGALQAKSPTIAVMGCGLDIVYPERNRQLFEEISIQGVLLSEFPLGTPPAKWHFPLRNRVVSGLALGVVIVEAAERSGTLITARLTLEQDRQLMVVPGAALNPQYSGSHRLIKQGAMVVTEVEDIVYTLSLPLQQALGGGVCDSSCLTEKTPQMTAERQLLNHIYFEPTGIDTIISASGLTPAEVSSMLLMLELEGLLAVTDEGLYQRLS